MTFTHLPSLGLGEQQVLVLDLLQVLQHRIQVRVVVAEEGGEPVRSADHQTTLFP